MRVDNTILEKFAVCPIGYKLRHEQGWTKKNIAAPLVFGSALHLGLAEWYRTDRLDLNTDERLRRCYDHIETGWPVEESGQFVTSDDYRSLDKCFNTMRAYAREYPRESWSVVQGPGGPMVEIPFCLPLGAWLDCQNVARPIEQAGPGRFTEECFGKPNKEGNCDRCGEPCEPIEYGGLIDAVIEHSDSLYVMDHKSTSQLGPTFFAQFRPNAQMTGYHWGAEQLSGRTLAGIYINVIGIFAKGPTRFERQPTSRHHAEVEEWRLSTIAKCNAIARAKRTGVFPLHEQNCVGKYGPCEFLGVHSFPTEDDRLRVLEQEYTIRPWVFDEVDR